MPERVLRTAYWDITAESVSGSAHIRRNKPCQDYQDYKRYDDAAVPCICLAVADGHGSEKSPKSALGAEIAVRKSLEKLQAFAQGVSQKPFDVINTFAQEQLSRHIVKEWTDAVRAKEPARADLPTLFLEYGSTLLSVLITPQYILYLQLGDGDILCVAADGSVNRPIPKNPRLFANETTSLSMIDKRTGQPNGWLETSIVLAPIADPQSTPALIIVSTDGYANSFSSEAGFLQVGSDMLSIIQTDGWAKVKRELVGWLKEATAIGSGDDITVGLLHNNMAKTTILRGR